MKRINKFIRKPFRSKVLYLEITCWLGLFSLALLTLPFRWIAPILGHHMMISSLEECPRHRNTHKIIARAIATMSRVLPWECRCLVQAMTAKRILGRRKIESTLYLGIIKQEETGLSAHAWIRSGNFILTGNAGIEKYTVVSTFS